MKKKDITTEKLFDLTQTIAAPLLKKSKYPWEALADLGNFILEIGNALPENEYEKIGKNIWVHRTVKLMHTVCMTGPLIICKGADIRNGAFFRGNVIIGEGAVAGNSCEYKNCIIFNGAQTPHYNYIGDSIIGYKAHMGASSLTSNLKSDKSPVKVHLEDGDLETGLKKFGAMVGDFAEIGCGCVLNPGTVVGRNSNVYPLNSVRGCVDKDSIYKEKGIIVKKIKNVSGKNS